MVEQVIEIGDWVLCGRGTKSGWGQVKYRVTGADGFEVEFPPCGYPASMTTIEGTYYVPRTDVLKHAKERPY